MSILDQWPKPEWKPRQSQQDILTTAADRLDEWDVLVVEAPTAFGKTPTSVCLLKWAAKEKKMKGSLLVPNNMLVQQIEQSYKLCSLKRRDQYACTNYSRSCASTKAREGGYCQGCVYTKALRRIRAVPYSVLNYHMYVAHKLKVPFVVIDEAHNALPMLQEMAGKKIWQRDVGYPDGLKTVGDMKEWLASCRGFDKGFPNDPKLALLRSTLDSPTPSYLIEPTTDLLRGREENVIKLLPLDAKDCPPYLWPKAKKIVLMSATINQVDVEDMGLGDKRILYLKAPSPIPPEKRPIYFVGRGMGSMSKRAQNGNIAPLWGYIVQLLEKHSGERGLIHSTYGLNELFKTHIGVDKRAMFHASGNKKSQFEAWQASSKVLFGAGMQEGLDLKDDQCRWQAIVKVPFASLEDTAIRLKAQSNPEWYAWQAIKLVCQAAGRVCRDENDYGVTYITDPAFERLFKDYEDLFPSWFKEALIM